MSSQDRAFFHQYMPSRNTFSEPLSKEHCRWLNKAIDKIAPAADGRAQCEHQIVFAIQSIEFCKRFEKVNPSPATRRDSFLKRSKRLRDAAEVFQEEMNDSVAASIAAARKVATLWEQAADAIPVSEGSRVQVESMKMAVYMAHRLLKMFGRRGPGLTEDGVWHKLANILYGSSIPYGYLKREHKRQRKA
jgi:hypothetical protein